MSRSLYPVVAAALVLTACGDDQAATSPADESPTTPSSTIASSTSPSATDDPTPTSSGSVDPATTTLATTTTTEATVTTTPSGPSVDVALADLAERLDVSRDDIEVVSVEEVTWRDGSLGCPEPGRSYTQALVDGQRIVLAVDGVEHAYHSGRGREPFYCPPERAQDPSPDPRT